MEYIPEPPRKNPIMLTLSSMWIPVPDEVEIRRGIYSLFLVIMA
jgi:hypothetical protein